MATKIFNNPRRVPIVTQPKLPDFPPEPKDPDKRTCACGCGTEVSPTAKYKRGHQKRERHETDKKFGKLGERRLAGFGLYICSNCIYFTKPVPKRTKTGCKAENIAVETSRPCRLKMKRRGGYFEPIKTSDRVEAIDVSDWDRDELMMLEWKAYRRFTEIQKSMIQRLKIADRVKFILNNELRRGEVVSLTQRSAIIDCDNGDRVTLKGEEVHLDRDPIASSQ